MKIEISFDAQAQKPHVTLIPESTAERDQIRILIAFSEVSFFIELDDDEDDLVAELNNPNPGEENA
jgi:hypothetical protein